MTWKFDHNIAKNFTDHARQHIPYYDQVIDQCIEICNRYPKNSKIIDVGSATGETLKKLKNNNFQNIFGVEKSQEMIDFCDVDCYVHHDENFPKNLGVFDVILINWTLHFIKDKYEYLKELIPYLSDNGTLVITDKVSTDNYPISFYHDLKKRNGVSEHDIIKKQNAIKDVMYINDVEWYYKNLKKLGFSKVYIQHAYWCFASFVCKK